MRFGFDISFTHRGGLGGLMVYASNDNNIYHSFKLELPYSNNKTQYEALIMISTL